MIINIFVVLLTLYFIVSTTMVSAKMLALFAAAFVIGYGFVKSEVGFTGAMRNSLINHKNIGSRVLLAISIVCTVLFLPFAGVDSLFGFSLNYAPTTIGVSTLIGAFVFGIGMQIAGGCASGTLSLAFAGNFKFIIALVFFILGSVVGAMHLPAWQQLPNFGTFSLISNFGIALAIVIQLAILLFFYFILVYREKKAHGSVVALFSNQNGNASWPKWSMIVIIPIFAFIIFVLKGSTWGVTSAFATWGAKILSALGLLDVNNYAYWANKPNLNGVGQSVFANSTSVTNFGLISGIGIAAVLVGKLKNINLKINLWHVASVVIGGFLMGYGARLASGCNIGALLGGVSIGDLHFLHGQFLLC